MFGHWRSASRWTVDAYWLCLLLPTLAAPVAAQRKGKDVPEFTRQGLLIANFAAGRGATVKLGSQAANAVRSRVAKLVNKRELDVVSGGDIAYKLELAGYSPDSTPDIPEMRSLGRYFRVDEYLWASVSNGEGGPTISGDLVLYRDDRLRQPLPPAKAPKLDSAAALYAQAVAAARAQLAPERRCENALRDGSASRAIAAAREGIAAYPRAAIARTCLVWALQRGGHPPGEVLEAARELLDIDGRNPYALEGAAISLDSLRQRDEAANYWLRLAATDTANIELASKVGYALVDGGNARRAEPFLQALAKAHPEELRFTQLLWRAAYDVKDWQQATAAGEMLLERDTLARADSVFHLRLATAYHSSDRPFNAVETLARGVRLFPKDARIYALYTQYVKAEADTVLPRGLAMFPRSAELLALNAKELRLRGKIAESLDATKLAVSLDSSMNQGQLMVAQLEIDLGRPDSALIALHRAVATEDSTLVAQFALAKGNALYRAANGTKASADFGAALRMLAFADSVRSSEQSRFLTGAAALGVAQAALTEAAKTGDKPESCRLARVGSDALPLARTGLQAGEASFGDAAKQSLAYLDQLEPFAQQQLKAVCSN
jgi:hypothetical protein